MGAIWVILSFILFKRDENKALKSDMISAMGVSAMAVIFLSLLGTLIEMIQQDIIITILVAGCFIIALWLIDNK